LRQSGSIFFDLATMALMSPSSASVTTSASRPSITARACARAAMRLLDGDRLAGLGLPVRGEGFVVGLVELPRRIVGDVEQRRVGVGNFFARSKIPARPARSKTFDAKR
jgi:hypothetical protein